MIWKISLFFSSISLISFPLDVCIRRYMRTLGNSFSNGVLAAPCCRNPKKLEVRTPEVFLNWSKQVQHVSRFQNSSKIATGCINGISILLNTGIYIYILVVMIQMIQIIQNCSLPLHLASHCFGSPGSLPSADTLLQAFSGVKDHFLRIYLPMTGGEWE